MNTTPAAEFIVKYSISPYLVPNMFMIRKDGKTLVYVLQRSSENPMLFEDVEEAERFWKASKPIGSIDLWCD